MDAEALVILQVVVAVPVEPDSTQYLGLVLTLLEDSAAVVCRKSLTAPACLIVGAGGVKVKKWRVSDVLRLACSLEHTLPWAA